MADPQRVEYRFVPAPAAFAGAMSMLCLAGFLFGIVTFSVFSEHNTVWIERGRHVAGLFPILAGLAGVLYRRAPKPVRVGDAGIGLEDGRDVRRIPWYEVQSVAGSATGLEIKTAGTTINISRREHPAAVDEISRQVRHRLPSRVADSVRPPGSERSLESVIPLGKRQLAGEKCAKTGKPITFEADAAVCSRCEAVYLKAEMPEACVICQAQLS